MQETLGPIEYIGLIGGITAASAAVVAAEYCVVRRYIEPAIEAFSEYCRYPEARNGRTLLKAIGVNIRETRFP
jgi:hypothetical protein